MAADGHLLRYALFSRRTGKRPHEGSAPVKRERLKREPEGSAHLSASG
jgi:hypothetical protein